ncbi:hypothetical protein NC652_037538 [Populus alba x Populus x berolinensis]|nr:hypothetical protein NC652_037538 [Populus alba x Populus x berolinensis]
MHLKTLSANYKVKGSNFFQQPNIHKTLAKCVTYYKKMDVSCKLAMYVINRLIAASCWQNIHAVPQHGAVFGIRVVDGYGAAC